MLDDDDRRPAIKGIFSARRTVKLGTGNTANAAETISYFFGQEREDGQVEVRMLSTDFVPVGEERTMGREYFLQNYFLEPELWYRLMTQRLVQGDYYRQKGQALEAQLEYKRVLAIDEDNIRATFGLGLTYLAMNQLEKASYVFEKLVVMDEAFMPEHKHLFNEFGISPRKKGLYEESLRHYARALELAGADEHLHWNMARAHMEQGDVDKMFDHLLQGLSMAPAHERLTAFLQYVVGQGQAPTCQSLKERLGAWLHAHSTGSKTTARPSTDPLCHGGGVPFPDVDDDDDDGGMDDADLPGVPVSSFKRGDAGRRASGTSKHNDPGLLDD